VSSCEQFSLSVDGVPPLPAPKAAAAKKPASQKSAKKPEKRLMKATYKPTLTNVRFVAIYDTGQAGGLRVKVGGAKFATLNQPLVLMDRAAAAFGSKATIVLENESPLPRTAVMLVGSDLPKAARTVELVKRLGPVAKKPARKGKKKK
jgi:hypothetical protein